MLVEYIESRRYIKPGVQRLMLKPDLRSLKTQPVGVQGFASIKRISSSLSLALFFLSNNTSQAGLSFSSYPPELISIRRSFQVDFVARRSLQPTHSDEH